MLQSGNIDPNLELEDIIAESRAWSTYRLGQREQVVKRLMNYFVQSLKLDKAPFLHICHFEIDDDGQPVEQIRLLVDGDLSGSYWPSLDRVYLQYSSMSDRKLVFTTTAHEMRHAFQYRQVVAYRNRGRPPARDDATRQIAAWDRNFEHPEHPYRFRKKYWDMAIEVDARKFEADFMDLCVGSEHW